MGSLEKFKMALGQKATGLSDAEVERLFVLTEKLSGVIFDMWKKKLTAPKEKGINPVEV